MSTNESTPQNTIIDAKQAIFDKIFQENQELREQNQELNRILGNFERLANEHEEQHKYFDDLENEILNADDLGTLTAVIQRLLATNFNIPIANVTLIDSVTKNAGFSLQNILEPAEARQKMNLTTAISSISEDDYNRLFPEHDTIITNNPDPTLLALFESLTPVPEATGIASAAFIPLLSRARTLGILNLASPDSEKFIPGTATDAVENLGRKLATVIENNLLSAQIQQLLRTDPLTKLYNRGVLDEVLPIEFARASRYNHPLSLIKIDLDDFREINNIYGHATGDQVLQEVGTLIISNLRQHDIGLRYGGDEFTIILPDTDSTEAQKVIDRLTHLVADKTIFIDQNIQLQIEMSAGFSNFPDDPATSAQTLLEIADNNLYEIKKKRGELASD